MVGDALVMVQATASATTVQRDEALLLEHALNLSLQAPVDRLKLVSSKVLTIPSQSMYILDSMFGSLLAVQLVAIILPAAPRRSRLPAIQVPGLTPQVGLHLLLPAA